MENFLADYGLWALAFFLFIDDLGFPFPTTTIIFSLSVIAKTNPEVSIWPILILAIIIPPISNSILFFASRHGLRNWLHKHGHRIFLTRKRIQKAEDYFNKYGEWTIFIAAMLTTIRPVSSVVAGSFDMNAKTFFKFHIPGLLIWAIFVTGSGYIFGNHVWEILQKCWPILLISIITFYIIKFVWKKYFKTNK